MRIHDLKVSCVQFKAIAKKSLPWTAVLFLAVLVLPVQQASAGDALSFFKNYFVTGDYVVGGVGIRGTGVLDSATEAITQSGNYYYATGTIHMNGVPGYLANNVPQHADIVAAYLYWETIASPTADQTVLAKGTFRGLPVVGTQIALHSTLACSGSGGGNGNQTGAQALLVYRADVLRYLPYAHDPLTGRPLGQRLVNDTDLTANGLALHTVSLPDSGAGGSTSPSTENQAYLTEGVSLVVVYRIAGAPEGAPLKSVVIYDGGYTFSSINPLMTQTMRGFYEASTTPQSIKAQMTHIVGDGRSNFQERLTVNGKVPTGVSTTNAFPGALGPAWDNLTFDVSNLMSPDDASISTMVTPGNPTSTACLSWGAIVFSTTVQDTDGDGLLDIWEKTSGLTDPNGQPLPDLPSMGADPNVKDIFVEIDYMCSNITNGVCDTGAGKHTHLPTQIALDKVGDAFAAKGFHIHFDVGNNYQGDTYVIPKSFARGGDVIAETSCGFVQSPKCLFPNFPGTVSWKNGYQVFKNGGTLAGTALPALFDHNRKDVFHYALFAHTLGLPKWRANDKTLTSVVVSRGLATATTQLPHGLSVSSAITVLGAPAMSGLNGRYSVSRVSGLTFTFQTTASEATYQNWGLAISNGVPRSNSGVSDVGGGDLMITLGLWDNSVGTDFMQASTFMHELGHNLDLGHGGDISDPANCKPNYQSTMSYLFQVRGLLDLKGVPHIDYSNSTLPVLNESKLNESPSGLGTTALPYLPRWFAPASASFLDSIVGTTPATKHCDGTPITDGAQMVRVDGTTLTATPFDWNGDGNTTEFGLIQDINFNGVTGQQLNGFYDWANLNVQQVGARRGAAASSLDVVQGQDNGDDLGIAGGDLGIAGGDLGIAGGDLGIAGGDLGIAGGDLGIAGGDLGIAGGDLGGELDFDIARSLGNAPNALAAAVVGFNIDLTWMPPNVDAGSISSYKVWRATCPQKTTGATCALSPSVKPTGIGFWTPGTPLCDANYNFCDTTTKNNTLYIYFVTATFGANQQSGASNEVKQSR